MQQGKNKSKILAKKGCKIAQGMLQYKRSKELTKTQEGKTMTANEIKSMVLYGMIKTNSYDMEYYKENIAIPEVAQLLAAKLASN